MGACSRCNFYARLDLQGAAPYAIADKARNARGGTSIAGSGPQASARENRYAWLRQSLELQEAGDSQIATRLRPQRYGAGKDYRRRAPPPTDATLCPGESGGV